MENILSSSQERTKSKGLSKILKHFRLLDENEDLEQLNRALRLVNLVLDI